MSLNTIKPFDVAVQVCKQPGITHALPGKTSEALSTAVFKSNHTEICEIFKNNPILNEVFRGFATKPEEMQKSNKTVRAALSQNLTPLTVGKQQPPPTPTKNSPIHNQTL